MRNVVFMGTPDFAVPTLEALLDSDYTVRAVFTQPDRPKGRKGELTPPPVKVCAAEHGIPVYQPRRIRDPENLVFLRDLEPDVIVVVAFGQILPKEILDLAPYGCINVHASLLPKFRGAAPIQWALIEGETHTGVTTMQMNEGLDTGDIILQEAIPIRSDDTGGSLFEKLSSMGAELLVRTLHALETQQAEFTPQPAESPTRYASILSRKDGNIPWHESAVYIERLIRGLSPWPGTYTKLGEKQLKIWKASVLEEGTEAVLPELHGTVPGTVVSGLKGVLAVQTGEGILRLEEVQMEGKKRMPAEEFLRGMAIPEGTVLGES